MLLGRKLVWAAVALSVAGVVVGCVSASGLPTGATPAVPTATLPAGEATPSSGPRGGVEVALAAIDWPEGPAAARVNGTDIPTATWRAEVTRQLQLVTSHYQVDWNDRENLNRLPEFLNRELERMIDLELLRQAAARENITVSEAEVQAAVERARQEIMAGGQYDTVEAFLQANNLTEESFKTLVSEQMLVERLLAAHGGPSAVEQVHARHILVPDEQTAKEVRARLAAGESFEALARAYSTDEASKEQGGDLGWVPRGLVAPEFDEVAFALEVGATSEPVETDFGYHVIRVEGRAVREMEEPVLTQIRQQKFVEWLEGERSAAKIEKFYTASPGS